MNEIPIVFYEDSMISRAAIIFTGLAAIMIGVAIWNTARSATIATLLAAGGVAIAGFGLIGSEVSLQGNKLRCGTIAGTIDLAGFDTATERENWFRFSGRRISGRFVLTELVLTGPDGHLANCELYDRLTPDARAQLLAEIRARLRA